MSSPGGEQRTVVDDETPWWMQVPEPDEPSSAQDAEAGASPLRAPAAPHRHLPRPSGPASPPVTSEPREPVDAPIDRLEHPGLRIRPADGDTAEAEAETAVPAGEPPTRRPPRSTVRRVAVVEPVPEPPPTTTGPTDRTEQLPQVADEIFATFSGPADPDPDATDPPATRSRSRTAGTPGRGLHLPPSLARVDRRAAGLGAIGLTLAVLLVVLVSKLGLVGGGGDPDPAASAPTTPRTQAVGDFSRRPDGLSKVGRGQAAALLAKVNESGSGSVVEAWTWNDKNGKNLIATLREPAPGGHVTLRVVHAADLQADGRQLRVMTDPGLPRGCSGTASFTPKSLQVADLDGDGVAEIAVGWTSRCSGDTASQVRLALITDGKKYIVRGTGEIGKGGSAKTDPASSSWPRGYVGALGTLFRSLYYKP